MEPGKSNSIMLFIELLCCVCDVIVLYSAATNSSMVVITLATLCGRGLQNS